MSGILYICATPIGNLEDITGRVLKTLSEVDIIACEDTRHSIKLLNHYNIKAKLISYHEYSSDDKMNGIISMLKDGKNIALISDAGTPAISDPGEELVKMCYENEIKVTSLPGPSALITALTISGLSTKKFVFEGFLSKDKKTYKEEFENIKNETRTIIMYESPHRLKTTLDMIYNTLGNRRVSLVRELTKKYEQVILDNVLNIIEYYKNNEVKGEFVVLIEGKSLEDIKKEKMDEFENLSLEEHMNLYIKKGYDKKEAMKLVAKDKGMTKSDVYRMLL